MGEIRKRCDDAPQSKSTSCEISESLFAQLSERALPARRARASLRRFSCGCRYHSTQWISFLSEIPRLSCACASDFAVFRANRVLPERAAPNTRCRIEFM